MVFRIGIFFYSWEGVVGVPVLWGGLYRDGGGIILVCGHFSVVGSFMIYKAGIHG